MSHRLLISLFSIILPLTLPAQAHSDPFVAGGDEDPFAAEVPLSDEELSEARGTGVPVGEFVYHFSFEAVLDPGAPLPVDIAPLLTIDQSITNAVNALANAPSAANTSFDPISQSYVINNTQDAVVLTQDFSYTYDFANFHEVQSLAQTLNEVTSLVVNLPILYGVP